MKDCCSKTIDKRTKRCKRRSDGKVFKLPRNTQREDCRNPSGFSQVASCASYKDCYKRRRGGLRTTLKYFIYIYI